MNATVSTASMAGMVFTLVLSIGVPVAALIFFKKKTGGKISSALLGSAIFIIFALLLESILHAAVVGAFGEAITGNPWMYALYGGLAAGLFEETGRLLAMRFMMKNSLTKENALLYGVGHGGAEAIVIGGLTYISNIALAILINQQGVAALLATVEESLQDQALTQLSALWTTPAYSFYLGGVERLAAFVLQICLSLLVYRAVREGKVSLFLLAVALHFLVDAGSVLLSGVAPAIAVEAVLVIVACAFALWTFSWYKREGQPVL